MYNLLFTSAGELMEYVPQVAYDAAALLLLIVLLLAVVVAAMGIISSLVDIAMYAVVAALGVGGVFLVIDNVEIDGALRLIAEAVEIILSAVL